MWRRALPLLFAVACSAAPATKTSPVASPTTPHHVLEREDLATVVIAAKTLTYRVTYSVNGKLHGEAVSGRWVTYQRPPLRRFDAFIAGMAAQDSVTVYYASNGNYICPMPYAPPCAALTGDAGTAALNLDIELLLRANTDLLAGAEVLEDRIGGQNVTCFNARPDAKSKLSPGSREIHACYTSDGIPMRMELFATDIDLEFEGTQLVRDVTDKDVTLPADALQ